MLSTQRVQERCKINVLVYPPRWLKKNNERIVFPIANQCSCCATCDERSGGRGVAADVEMPEIAELWNPQKCTEAPIREELSHHRGCLCRVPVHSLRSIRVHWFLATFARFAKSTVIREPALVCGLGVTEHSHGRTLVTSTTIFFRRSLPRELLKHWCDHTRQRTQCWRSTSYGLAPCSEHTGGCTVRFLKS